MGWILLIAAIVFSLGRKIYYMENFNEKSFPLPTEISYAEVPAVRLENLIDELLTWTGTAFDPSLEGLRFEPDRAKTFSYDIDKKYGQIKNFGTDYKHIPGIEKKIETRQQMQNVEGIEWELDTMYTRYSGVKEAEGGFSAEVKADAEWEEYWKKKEIDIPKSEPLPVGNAFFDELHVCRAVWTEETDYHMVCRKGAQLMEVDYQGDDRTDAILKEVEEVFLAQK